MFVTTFSVCVSCWLTVLLQGTCGLKLIGVNVPPQRLAGESARLQCRYDLEGDALYSVKWYRGAREFFRYVPRDSPPIQVFPLDGIHVDLSQSDREQVVLVGVNLATSGRFRCEVSAEANFQTRQGFAEMSVVVLPDADPEISGLRPFYRPGEMLSVNCTSRRSKPAAALAWYINGVQVHIDSVIEYAPVVEPGGLETSILGLRLFFQDVEQLSGPQHASSGSKPGVQTDSARESVTQIRKSRSVVMGEEARPSSNQSSRNKSSSSELTLMTMAVSGSKLPSRSEALISPSKETKASHVIPLAHGVRLSCTASLTSLYWKSVEDVARPEEPPKQRSLEGRPEAATSSSADHTLRPIMASVLAFQLLLWLSTRRRISQQ